MSSTALTLVEDAPTPQTNGSYQVIDPIPVLDTSRFEQMQRIAKIMAQSSMIPEALYMMGKGNDRVELPLPAVVSNCFLVVNQAVRWGMDPFAVAQCVSVIKGKICYEGKLIAAVLEAKLGLKIVPEWNDKKGDEFGVEIFAYDEHGEVVCNPRTKAPLTVRGTVCEWKTTGDGSPWSGSKNHARMLVYRGTREWVRLYRSGIMLGVYADDEMEELSSGAHSSRPRDVAPPIKRVAPPPSQPETQATETKPEVATVRAAPAPEPETAAAKPEKVTPAAPRRAPPPSQPEPEEPKFSPPKSIEAFKAAALDAQDVDALELAWTTHISPIEDRFLPHEHEEAAMIDRMRRKMLEP